MRSIHPLVIAIAASLVAFASGCEQPPPPTANVAQAPTTSTSVVSEAAATDQGAAATAESGANTGGEEIFMLSVEQDTATGERVPDVVFVPTPPKVVDAMLTAAKVGPDDVLYDLGSGDGRIPITAARRWGTRGVGIDIDPERIEEANRSAKQHGVTDKVKFIEGDLFEADLSKATVISLYLLPNLNLRLRPTLLKLKPGTRIVSHAFDMGDWKPERTIDVDGATVYLWTVPETVPSHLTDASTAR